MLPTGDWGHWQDTQDVIKWVKNSVETTSLQSWFNISASLHKQEFSWSSSGVHQWIFSPRSGFLISSKPKQRRIYMSCSFSCSSTSLAADFTDLTGNSSLQETAGFKIFSVGECSDCTSKYKVRQWGKGGKIKSKLQFWLTVIPLQLYWASSRCHKLKLSSRDISEYRHWKVFLPFSLRNF